MREQRRTFAYTGLLTCEHCGCAITAEMQKGKYIYYHCTRARGECPARPIREDRLEALLGELVQRVAIDEETMEWVVAALKESQREKESYHGEQVVQLQEQLAKLEQRLDAVYEDRLDGKVTEEFWARKTREWRDEHLRLLAALERHQKASESYVDTGVKVLQLAQRAYSLWLAQAPTEKRKLLNLLLSNCTFDGETLRPTYRKPFCWMAEGSLRNVWRG